MIELEFVTDRTQADVDRLKKLRAIGWNNMTVSQKEEYRGRASLGAYNYKDMNRVEQAVSVLGIQMGLSLVRYGWYFDSIPTESQMQGYLGNVKAIRDKYGETHDISGFPALPDSMSNLTWEGANNIEKVLELIWNSIRPATHDVPEAAQVT
jgi:hypothetical protein